MAGNNGEIFERTEKKYLLTGIQFAGLIKKMEPYMRVDQYGKSTICNVYYDTSDFSLIRKSIEKPVYKEKLRLRSYGIPSGKQDVFIEIKKKYDGIVYKRRIALPCKAAENYLNHGIRPKEDVNPQIFNELEYFKLFYGVIPKMFIAYDRVATYGIEDPSIRITFDWDIRYRETDLNLRAGDEGKMLLDEGTVLMEIKVGRAYPLWLTEILTKFAIYPVSFSKYGRAYQVREEKEKKICLPA